MALAGYPKTYDHPVVNRLIKGVPSVSELSGGTYMLIKAMGDLETSFIEYKVKYPNSANPDTEITIRTLVGTSLTGPFSYVKHSDETTAGDYYTLVHEVED